MTPRPGVGPRAAAWFVDAIVGFLAIGIPRAALVRNVLRLVDALPYVVPDLVAAVALWNDRGPNRRLGDRAAGTVVAYR